MADNLELDPGSGGATAATDDVGGVHYQKVKLADGSADSSTMVAVAGGVEANALRVTIASDSTGVLSVDDNGAALTVDNGGTFAVQVDGSALTALQKIDDPVLVDDAAFTPATSSVMMIGAEFDDTGTDPVDEGDAGAVRMSGNRNLYVNIRDNAGNERGLNIDANGEIQISGTRNALPITDNAGSLTVDGTVAVTNTGTFAVQVDNSVAVTNAGLTELAAAIDTEVQVDIVGALPAGTNAIGKLAANSGVDIGDVDVTTVGTITPGTAATSLGKAEDDAHNSGDVGVAVLGVRKDTPNTALTGTDGDYTALATNKLGSVRVALQEDDFAVAGSNHVKKYYTSAGAATDGIIWSPAAGKRWYVTDIFINVSAAATVTLEDDLAGGDSAVWKAELAANSGWSHSFNTPLFSGEDAADLIITTTAGNVYVTVTGYEI